MFDIFDDELDRMFEDDNKKRKQKLNVAISLNDSIDKLPKNKFISLPDNTLLVDVIEKLQTDSTGCVLLENNGVVNGIFTERDALTKILGKKLVLETEIISNYMTNSPECLHWDDPISFALNKMVSGGYRHIPIVNESNQPMGVISMQNIIHQLGDYFFDEIVNLPPKPLREQTTREGG